MSNSYTVNQPWAHDQLTYSQHQLQLEHEFDFTPGHLDNPQPQPHQHQHQRTFPEAYQPQFSSDNFSASNPAFVSNQGPHSRGLSFESNSSSSFPVHGIYGSSQNQHQNQTTFNATPSFLNQPPPESHRSYHNNTMTYDHQTAVSPTPLTATSLSAVNSGPIATPILSTSPGPIQQVSAPFRPPQFNPSRPTSGSTHTPKVKRPRVSHRSGGEEEDDPEMGADSKEGVKAKAGGACARCKNLKVKCEFKTDTDPCKRCLNGGHDCVIPGRKPRRTPPKREHLLNQIREQATEIQKLMSQLEATNARQHRTSTTSETAPRTHTPEDLHSPVLSPSSTSTSYFGSDTANQIPNPNINPETNKAVEDWIAKARESLAEFGGFIGIGGAGMPKSYLVEDDPEDSEGSWEGVDDIVEFKRHEGEYEFAIVEDSDGEDVVHEEEWSGRAGTDLRQRSSMSSLNTSATGTTSGLPRKKNSGGSAKLATVPGGAAPFGLMADLSLKKHRRSGSSASPEANEEGTHGLGVANVDFFRSSPAPDPMRAPVTSLQQQAPHILTRGVVTPQEAEKLFAIYFKRMNLSVSLLDPELYTAQRTCYRSSFLFTVICAIASRYYTERPELYGEAMHYAQLAAGTSLISGHKSVEMCQGYILLSLYPVPARRWDEDRSWLYLGLAIRIAMDLNLHHPSTAKPLNENHAREMLNRTRVWLNCFNLDRSTGSQYGKSPVIPNTDYIANHSEDWWQSSPYNMKHFDIHICAYNAELRVMAAFMAKIYSDPRHRTGLNKNLNFEQTATETDDELQCLGDKWFAALDQTDMSDPQNCFRTGLLRLAYGYARLVALSHGLQYAFGKNNTDGNPFVLRCVAAASDIVNTVVDNVGRSSQRVYLRHGPEAQSVFVTFASAFLVKLLQQKFAAYLTTKQRLEIRGLVNKVIDLLGSAEVAIDDRHGPKLYARFLKDLLATPLARVNSQSPNGINSTKTLPRQRTQRPNLALSQTLEPAFELPSTVSSHTSPATDYSLSPSPQPAMFDPYGPIGGGINDFIPVSSPPDSLDTTQDGLGVTISTPDFYRTPLPFENEMLQSMQSLTDSSVWEDISLPGFNWMSQFQNDDIHMKTNDSMMYDPNTDYMTGAY